MSAIISLVSQKGGVGKSAIARLLAVEFVRAGWTVKIADIDTMQGTSTKWKLRRDAANLQPEIPVEKFATVDRALRDADKYDLMLIDGPAHAEKGGLAMARKSKLVLMPTCYGLDDLEAQIEAAYELEENGIDPARVWFIFSRTTGSPNEEQTAREYLHRARINVLEPILAELPSIRQAHSGGKAASEVSFPVIRERATALAVSVATKLQELRDVTEVKAEATQAKTAMA
jgi:chromosome partitioning protein|nr:ParA family protein [uncultured Rhodopila sp.]